MKNTKTIIIAEIGVNHNGQLSLAKKLIKEANKAGADLVKFQIFKTDNLVTKIAPKAKYQINKNKKETQYNMLKKYELSNKDLKKLSDYCDDLQIGFLASVFDIDSLEYLKKLKTKIIKIPSGEINNLPLLEKIGKLKKKIILSSGMSTMNEINDAIKILTKSGTKIQDITVLHCTTSYPTNFVEVNLNSMLSIKKNLNVDIGYSDHTLGSEVSLAAVTLGAKIIERHFTIDKNLRGPDHKSSLTPKEFKYLVKSIRNIELSLGSNIKKPSKNEKKNMLAVRKSIVARTQIKKGDKFSSQNITIKRPGNGKSPMLWYNVIGKKSKKNYKINEQI